MTDSPSASPSWPEGRLRPDTWFDIVTIDTTEPRAHAALYATVLDLEIAEDEDDGRWVMLARRGGDRLVGFQRADRAEVENRARGRGRIELAVVDSGAAATVLNEHGGRIDHRGRGTDPFGLDVQVVDGARRASIAAVFDVADPIASAGFWADVAGLHLMASNPVRIDLGLDDEVFVAFRRREAPGPRSLVHLDLACAPEAFDNEVRRLLDLGAARLGPDHDETYGRNRILVDPAGLIFCQNAYRQADPATHDATNSTRGRREPPAGPDPVPVSLSRPD